MTKVEIRVQQGMAAEIYDFFSGKELFICLRAKKSTI